jgi:hypothetical protein
VQVFVCFASLLSGELYSLLMIMGFDVPSHARKDAESSDGSAAKAHCPRCFHDQSLHAARKRERSKRGQVIENAAPHVIATARRSPSSLISAMTAAIFSKCLRDMCHPFQTKRGPMRRAVRTGGPVHQGQQSSLSAKAMFRPLRPPGVRAV